jgi:hypothetical protein
LLTRVPCGSGNRRRGTTVKVSGQARWAKSSEYITQVSAIGPLGLEYLNAKDDPRNNHVLGEIGAISATGHGRHSESRMIIAKIETF